MSLPCLVEQGSFYFLGSFPSSSNGNSLVSSRINQTHMLASDNDSNLKIVKTGLF